MAINTKENMKNIKRSLLQNTIIDCYRVVVNLVILMTLSLSAIAQNCEVKLESISGNYEGDCKKGLANGKGKSVGTDTYEGEFKKGFPNGPGVYNWANGDVFTGEFKKGLKEGKGMLTSPNKTPLDGYWLDDDYIGKESSPYKVMNKAPTVSKITVKRKSADKNQIDIIYQQLGRKVSYDDIKVSNQVGNFGSLVQNKYVKAIQAVVFPFRFMVNSDDNFDIQISQPGHWEVTVDIIKN